ncbi:Ras-related C3 botulinum toxin substrate 1 (Rho family, small GTP-binding Rac1)-like protein (macronuclear) [Tetrahymena thermophila SB210]|uniref:Ras-related C3 botulinum toxin substrate 1 (Rho family, small GTP-binding Rac1)-like protein n=1 Tax=Tetrahymena thermophila (strain SB210) TaxID=312017 RepID=I7MFL8_TETTS|nr:Ras-related C3 botulinum toxin substrate 1 (Rho family, small GTP-binding Rac1)-like protein [Tetrahymena thermophila SB210]EAS00331.2 Ras-related C3 botulinum toxin substrate 1 (Rho family, small GTP-binding Rac1)-like protein [Tetrahymena thermophila SB210]|eukprot:XP_001020576.2 Ras-related C3 botulinum toxin substrate 1 (Rho family, small GTP-binding Rac1)-like protein [Tetrahymena thermophila SB210]
MICIDKKQFDDQGPIPMKLVAVGDGAVGKTCILHRYMNDTYSEEHIPTIFENSFMMVKIDKKTVQLGIWDTAGQEEYNRLRPLSYSNTDIFLIVFSVVDPESFDNALKKWYPELQQVQPKSLKVFVGNKIDLLESEQSKKKSQKNAPVNSQQVKQIVNELGCEYFECSAKSNQGIKELFLQSIQDGMNCKQKNQKPRKHQRCTLI